MKQWFLALTQREQLAVMLMTAVLLVWMLTMLLLLPLKRERARLAENNRAAAEAVQRVDELASALRAQRQRGAQPARGRNLTVLLNRSAETAGLSITRLQPNSRGAVQLRFESVPFPLLIRWLNTLEQGQGLLLEEVSINQAGAAGVVGATIRVSAPS